MTTAAETLSAEELLSPFAGLTLGTLGESLTLTTPEEAGNLSAGTTPAPATDPPSLLPAAPPPSPPPPPPAPSPAASPPPRQPLLALLEDLPDFFTKEVLGRLDPTDRAVLAQVGWPWLAAVVRAAAEDRLPCAGKSAGVPLKLVDFVGSVARLMWAKANGCPWGEARAYTPPLFGST